MRFRFGLLMGFAAGYYLGARAGHERYEQINRWLHQAKQSDAYEGAAEKARAVIDLGVERARDLVEGDGGEATVDVRPDQPPANGPSYSPSR